MSAVSRVLFLFSLCFTCINGWVWTDTILQWTRRSLFAPQNKIIEGEAAVKGRFPYMVSLTQRNALQCGGTLIAPDVILTAAHCMSEIFGAEIGRYNITDATETYETHVFQTTVPHPLYFAQSAGDVDEFDYLLIKIYDVSTNGTILKLNTDPSIPSAENTELTVLGWGKPDVNTTEPRSDVLQTAELFYIPNDECSNSVGIVQDSPVNYSDRVIPLTLCAADFDEGDDACTGDSGGPILLEGTSVESDVQLGVTSYGFGCAHPTLPGIYARVSAVDEWIRENVCTLSLQPPSNFNCSNRTSDDSEPDATGELVNLLVQVFLDDQSPQETGWIIQSVNQNGILATHYIEPIGNLSTNNITTMTADTSIQLPNNRQYVFTIFDSYGDGNVQATILQQDDSNTTNATTTNQWTPILTTPVLTGGYAVEYDLIVGDLPTSSPTTTPSPTSSPAPSAAPTITQPFITIMLKFDSFPEETGWIVESLEPTQQIIQQVYVGTYQDYDAGDTVMEQVYLLQEKPMTYRFTIMDNELDGICCSERFSNGLYQLWYGDVETGTLLAEGGEFVWQSSHEFTVTENGTVPTLAPNQTPSPTPSPTPSSPTTTPAPNEELATPAPTTSASVASSAVRLGILLWTIVAFQFVC